MDNLPLEILRRIPRGSKITATQLHASLKDAGLDRTKRTIERQLASLCELFEIECDSSSKPYGYRWKPLAEGVFIPGLNAQEALLLKLAKEHLNQLLPANLLSGLGPIFEQADRKLRDAHALGAAPSRDKLSRQWLDKVKVVSTTVPMLPPKVAPGVFEAVSEALFANQWLDIQYQNAQGKATQKRVMPLGLAQQGVRLFVVCRFEGYTDNRNLALQRIKSATATGLPFERPADFDLQAYDDNGRFANGNGVQIALELWVDDNLGLLLAETPLANDQTLSAGPEPKPWVSDAPRQGHLLTATVVQSANLVWWLRSQCKALKVLGPRELVNSL